MSRSYGPDTGDGRPPLHPGKPVSTTLPGSPTPPGVVGRPDPQAGTLAQNQWIQGWL
jgi:hypothetical protein